MRVALLLAFLFLAVGCSKEFVVKEGDAIDAASFNLLQPIKQVCRELPDACDEPPILIAATAPRYPSAALARGQTGQAEVYVVIDIAGSTSSAKLLTATSPEFGAAAMAAVKSWRFQPARKAGVPVPIEGKLVFPFELR